ncbi:MAG TPA: SusC/RagA family TonB-linked outer membrane protein [Longimicrobiales bacterium]
MGRIRRSLGVTLALLLLLAASPLAAQGPAGTIRGRVVDGSTQQPLPGVIVSVGERTTLTDTEGRYLIVGVPAGTHTVRAASLGYATASGEVAVVAGQSAALDFSLVPEALALRGIVVVGYGQQRARDVTGSVELVSVEEFNTGRVISAEQLIAAKVAGVNVIDTGEPGGGISLRVRGGTSVTSSNEPLIVVDGIPLAIGGGLSMGRNALNFLDPNDIASVTLLKDASATAIYGSRGANGVLLIQTKSAARGPEITYTSSFSISTVTRQPDVLSAEQFRRAVQEHAPEKLSMLGNANTDWRDAVQRRGQGQEHHLAFSGATDDLDYRFSLGYLEQNGVIEGSATERLSASLNYGQRFFDGRLSVRANVKGSRTKDALTPGGVLGAATTFAPTQPIRDENSPYGGFFEWEDALAPNNPVAELRLSTEEATIYRSIGSLEGEYRAPFLEGLSATLRLGYDVAKGERLRFYPSFLRWQVEQGIGGQVNRENPTQVSTLLEAFANYTTRLERYGAEVDLTAGYTYEESRGDYPSFLAQGLSFDLLGPNGVPAAAIERTFLTVEESRLISGFGRVNLTLADRYLMTLSLRRDGSSRFGPSRQWGTFPAASFAWWLSQEEFMQRLVPGADLKLRLSWGVNGNQAFPNYRAFSDYVISDPTAQVQFGDSFVTTIRPSAADPNIKWEETTSYNIGLDYGLFGGRLSGAIDVYRKDTEDLIFTVPVAAGTNLSNFVTTNIGSMKNEGVELSLSARILDGALGGLSWIGEFNAAYNRNELVRINPFAGGGEQILTGGIAGGVGNNIQVLKPGYPINSFFVFRHKRDAQGRPIYEDTNGDGTINEQDLYENVNGDALVNQDDRVPFESPAPDWILGHTSRLAYGGFDLSFTLRAHLGNYVYNNVASNQGHYRALRDGAPDNLHASVLETGFEEPQYFSDYYVEPASFLRMENLTLGYSFTRAGRPMRVFATVQNVFTLTEYSGVDPMAGVNGIDNDIYPRSRTFSGGISVRF